tara:strand:- start:355 stop:771 length:417 start_codon:yes stop_codon:yes gene_type:complete
LNSEELKIKIQSRITLSLIAALPAIIFVQILFGILYCIFFILIYAIFYFVYMRKITKCLKKTTEKLTFTESLTSSSKSHNLVTLVFLAFFSILFVISGVWIFLSGTDQLVGLMVIGFFGCCGFVIGKMILVKIQHDKM